MVIFGGIATETHPGEDRPKVFDDFHMIDLNDNFFTSPFTANIRPSARYGHASSSNIQSVSEEGDESNELIILGGLDFQYCTMDPYILKDQGINEHTKWELTKVSKVKADNTNNLESTIKLANRNIMENRKIIASLEKNLSDMSEELALLKYRKREMDEELEVKRKSFREAVKQFKEKDRKLIQERVKAETKLKAMYELVELEQRMQAVIVRKIDLIEKNFAKAESFLIILDTFMNKLKAKNNQSNISRAINIDVDMGFLDSQKNQHRQNLK